MSRGAPSPKPGTWPDNTPEGALPDRPRLRVRMVHGQQVLQPQPDPQGAEPASRRGRSPKSHADRDFSLAPTSDRSRLYRLVRYAGSHHAPRRSEIRKPPPSRGREAADRRRAGTAPPEHAHTWSNPVRGLRPGRLTEVKRRRSLCHCWRGPCRPYRSKHRRGGAFAAPKCCATDPEGPPIRVTGDRFTPRRERRGATVLAARHRVDRLRFAFGRPDSEEPGFPSTDPSQPAG